MEYCPKGEDIIKLDTIILDLNGTLAVNGMLVEGVADKIAQLLSLDFKIYLFSGDQRGTASMQAQQLGIEYKYASTTTEKEILAQSLDNGRL